MNYASIFEPSRATYGQEFGDRHLILIAIAVDVRQSGQLQSRRACRHQHHGEPEHGVVAEPVSSGSDQVDDANGYAVDNGQQVFGGPATYIDLHSHSKGTESEDGLTAAILETE